MQMKVEAGSLHRSIHSTLQIQLLPTALVVQNSTDRQHECRVMLRSRSTIITENCVQRFSLQRNHARMPVHGLESLKAGVTRGVTNLNLCTRKNLQWNIEIEALNLKRI